MRLNFCHLCLIHESDGGRENPWAGRRYLYLVESGFRACLKRALKTRQYRIDQRINATNAHPRTIAINHVVVTLQFIKVLSKVVVRLRRSKVAVMTHGIAEIKDLGDEVWCCGCPTHINIYPVAESETAYHCLCLLLPIVPPLLTSP